MSTQQPDRQSLKDAQRMLTGMIDVAHEERGEEPPWLRACLMLVRAELNGRQTDG